MTSPHHNPLFLPAFVVDIFRERIDLESQFLRPGHGLVPRVHAELAVDRQRVCLDGVQGQVQVLPDLLGLLGATAPRHAGRIANLRDEAIAALATWRTDVESGNFPTAAQGIAGDVTLIAALDELPR